MVNVVLDRRRGAQPLLPEQDEEWKQEEGESKASLMHSHGKFFLCFVASVVRLCDDHKVAFIKNRNACSRFRFKATSEGVMRCSGLRMQTPIKSHKEHDRQFVS